LPAKSLYANLKYVFALVLLCSTAVALAACGTDAPTATPARPTATVEAVRPHPTRPPRPTATAVVVFDTETPTPSDNGGFFSTTPTPAGNGGFFDDTPTPVDNGGFFNSTPTPSNDGGFFNDAPTPEGDTTQYTVYVAPEGDWSVEYPSDWLTNVDVPNYQFSNVLGDAFIQVTYSQLDSTATNEDMVQVASEQFKANFVNYIESDQVEQSDGSYRIDFKFDVPDDTGTSTTQWDAQAFVETRQQHLYMLMLASTQDAYLAGTYDDIISHVIDSYTVPSE
jgi:hypothetical protein